MRLHCQEVDTYIIAINSNLYYLGKSLLFYSNVNTIRVVITEGTAFRMFNSTAHTQGFIPEIQPIC